MELRYQDNSPIQPFIILMKMLRTGKYSHSLYELIKLHLWGYIDETKTYHSIHLLHDDDFVYFTLNLENLSEFHYIFAMELDHIMRYIHPEIKATFLKETRLVEKSMLLWNSLSADSV
jgi:hypothetical protein